MKKPTDLIRGVLKAGGFKDSKEPERLLRLDRDIQSAVNDLIEFETVSPEYAEKLLCVLAREPMLVLPWKTTPLMYNTTEIIHDDQPAIGFTFNVRNFRNQVAVRFKYKPGLPPVPTYFVQMGIDYKWIPLTGLSLHELSSIILDILTIGRKHNRA